MEKADRSSLVNVISPGIIQSASLAVTSVLVAAFDPVELAVRYLLKDTLLLLMGTIPVIHG